MIVKIVATFLRYQVFLGSDKRSDAIQYNQYGQDYIYGIAEPLDDLRKTNFIRFLTAHVYVLIGPDLIAAFLVFGIFAFFGDTCGTAQLRRACRRSTGRCIARSCSSPPASRSGRHRSARKR